MGLRFIGSPFGVNIYPGAVFVSRPSLSEFGEALGADPATSPGVKVGGVLVLNAASTEVGHRPVPPSCCCPKRDGLS